MRQKIKINSKVLKWARESAHLKISEIPKYIIKQETLDLIEKGKLLPTIIQIEKLAKKYGRPISILLQDEIPKDDYQMVPVFRKQNKTDYTSQLVLFIREIQRKQNWARNFLIEEGYDKLDFLGTVNIDDDIKKVAQVIRKRIELPFSNSFNNTNEYLNEIRNKLEDNNIFVSITGSKIDLEQAEGFALIDDFAPFIFINTKSSVNKRIFTAIHEIVHLFLGKSGISENIIKFRKSQCEEDKIENFCNDVASEILMPEEEFRKILNKEKGSLLKKICKLSKFFLVSELAVCVRLWRLKILNYNEYKKIYSEIENEIYNFLQKKLNKKSNGGDYYNSQRSKNGLLLTKLAFYAYKSGQVLQTDLYRLLNVKINNLDKYFEKI